MWFFIALIAFITAAVMMWLVCEEIYRRGLGTEPEDRVTSVLFIVGFGCTLATAISGMITAL